jgi:AbrB family looped-hinge helix DNA binding protein
MVIPMSNTKTAGYTSKLTSKSQITVPSRVRERLNLRPGDRGVWVLRGDEVVLVSARRYAQMTAGMLAGTYGRSRGAIRRYLEAERGGW